MAILGDDVPFASMAEPREPHIPEPMAPLSSIPRNVVQGFSAVLKCPTLPLS
jgi:hypothetical protein